MKRPLAYAGFFYLCVQLGAVFLPSASIVPLAAFFAVAAIIAATFAKGRYRAFFVLFTAVAAAALVLRTAFTETQIKPLYGYDGKEAAITAVVRQSSPGYRIDSVNAVVSVREINGEKVRPFNVRIQNLPYTMEGETFSARVKLNKMSKTRYTLNQYADGVFLEGVFSESFSVQDDPKTYDAWIADLRNQLSAKLQMYVPHEYADMASAITIGKKSALSSSTKDSFRNAGLSHVLVVSGMHLSAVSGLVYMVLRWLLSRRAACVAAIGTVIGFMLLIGGTPSVLRAGISMLLLYLGGVFQRKSDALTSLGAAALFLCLCNPYAAVDIGLLLSFSATIGVLWVGAAQRRSEKIRKKQKKPISRIKRWMLAVLWTAAVPLATALTTLPVLVSIDAGVSLLTVLSNLLVVPLIPFAVGLGLITAVIGFVPLLDPLAHLTGILCAVFLRGMTWVAECAASVPYAFVHISGTYAFCVSILLCGGILLCWHKKVSLRKTAVLGASFLLLSCTIYGVYDSRLVHVRLAGNGENPAVVFFHGLETAVVFRGPESNENAVRRVLQEYNRTNVDFLADLRLEGDTEKLAQGLSAQTVVCVRDDVKTNRTFRPIKNVELYIKKQKQGTYVLAWIGDFRLGLNVGKPRLTGNDSFHVYVAGSGEPQELRTDKLIETRGLRRWKQIPAQAERYKTDRIDIHIKKGIRIKEEIYDFE